MNNFLRNLTATQQIGALFLVVFGILSITTIWAYARMLREQSSDDPQAEAEALEAKRFWGAQDLLGHGHRVLDRLGAG